MNKFYFILTLALLCSCKKDKEVVPTAPEPNPIYFTFSGQIGTNDNSTVVSSDNNLIICGNSGTNLSVLKITKGGTQQWRKDFAAGNNSSASSIIQSPSQDFFI